MSSCASAAAYAACVDAERRAASSARSAALSCGSESPAATSARAPASAASAVSAHAAAAAAAAVHAAPGPLRRGERRGFLVAGTAEREEEDAVFEEEAPECCRLSICLSSCLASTSLISSTSLSST